MSLDKGKIERWHQTLKNRILLENYYLPGQLEAQVDAVVEHYNHHRYHKSLHNSHPPTSTAVDHRPSCSSANASRNRHSDNDACSTSNKPPNINSVDEPTPPLSHNAFCLNHSTTDIRQPEAIVL